MQSQDLAQLSESLLSLLSVQNGSRYDASNPQYDFVTQQVNPHPINHGQPYLAQIARLQQEPQYGLQPPASEQNNHQQTAYDPWGRSFHGLHNGRPVTGASGPYPVSARSSQIHHAAMTNAEGSSCSPADSTVAWGSYPQSDGLSSRSLPEQLGLPTSNKLASGLWGGSLWSNGCDSIWSTAVDRPHLDGQPPASQEGPSQDDSQLDRLLMHRNATAQRQPPPGFPAQQFNLIENGHAMPESSRPNQLHSNLAFPQDRQAEIRHTPSALLAALQGGAQHAASTGGQHGGHHVMSGSGQHGMPNGAHHSVATAGQHVMSNGGHQGMPINAHHLMPNGGQPGVFMGSQHAMGSMLNGGQLAAQLPHLQHPQHPLQALFQQHQQQQQQNQQQQQQLQVPPAAQSPPVSSHLGRMPPPGFPRPLQQNLQDAQQQRAAAARAFSSPQVSIDIVVHVWPSLSWPSYADVDL